MIVQKIQVIDCNMTIHGKYSYNRLYLPVRFFESITCSFITTTILSYYVNKHARLFASTGYGSVSQSSRDLDRAARKDLNLERRRSKLAELERKEKEAEKAERLAKQRELAKSLADTLRYRPSA